MERSLHLSYSGNNILGPSLKTASYCFGERGKCPAGVSKFKDVQWAWQSSVLLSKPTSLCGPQRGCDNPEGLELWHSQRGKGKLRFVVLLRILGTVTESLLEKLSRQLTITDRMKILRHQSFCPPCCHWTWSILAISRGSLFNQLEESHSTWVRPQVESPGSVLPNINLYQNIPLPDKLILAGSLGVSIIWIGVPFWYHIRPGSRRGRSEYLWKAH